MERNLAEVVIHALARVEGVESEQLDYKVYNYIDTDALLALDAHEESTWELIFEVPDHEVTVTSDGEIVIDGTSFKKDGA